MQARQGLTIATGAPVSPGRSGVQKNTATPASAANTRSSSPVRPPVSPITPTFGPTKLPGDVPTSTALASKPPGGSSSSSSTSRAAGPNAATAAAVVVDAVAAAEQKFAQDRKAFTHAQPDQVGAVPPAAEPIAFEDNPDVLAIQSAITILQLQRAKAMTDMQALSRIKNDALADPAAFLADLQAGRVRAEGDRLFVESVAGEDEDEDDSSSEDDDADDEKNTPAAAADENMMDVDAQPTGEEKIAAGPAAAKAKRKRQGNKANTPAKSWHKLPKPQNIVRTPPVNWAQYGVMGESLDKLHAEQRAAPAQGTPLTLGAGRTFEFKAGEQPAGEQRRLVGIAAPYTPGKDKLDKKGKGAKR